MQKVKRGFIYLITRRGTEQPNSKLTEDDVREIRRLRGEVSQNSLAERFGVSQQQVKQIQLRKAWRHVL